jgi:hypothetical protein
LPAKLLYLILVVLASKKMEFGVKKKSRRLNPGGGVKRCQSIKFIILSTATLQRLPVAFFSTTTCVAGKREHTSTTSIMPPSLSR